MKTTISYTVTRTFNLGDYENIKPTISIVEEHDEEVDYHKEFARIKQTLRKEIQEDSIRVKKKDVSYPTEAQLSKIMFECKKQKIDIDTLANEHGFPSILSLSFDEATIIINQLTK